MSVQQEDHIAKSYNGRRSPSSGAQDADRGDVRYMVNVVTGNYLYTAECKATKAASISLKKDVWLKIQEEAEDQERRPCMFLRFYDETTGEALDLVVRDVRDDLEMFYG